MFAIRARDAGVHMNIVNHSSLKRKTYFSNGLLALTNLDTREKFGRLHAPCEPIALYE
jgi:hypothetical protein